ncbi:pyruvate:ferredoxin (flavodoxin) oxidoreductase [Pirellulaceae bacterium SH449]
MKARTATIDGNEAVARVAYALSEVIAIYPITPATPMGEWADEWSSRGVKNCFGDVPHVVEMQSEGGAAGALHGALQGGALGTTFTASQGLLLMIPNMFKIAGELTPTVIHVAARAVATHALSIFGDHSDVMTVRNTGFAMLASASVQEAHDMACVAHAASLKARIPFLHFFDGFRTSHEINKISLLSEDDIQSMIDREALSEHRARSLDPNRPVLRGSAQNPDVFFQSREAVNSFYDALPAIVEAQFEQLAQLTGRSYQPFEYEGASNAEQVIVMMGSGCGAAREMVRQLNADGKSVGLLKVRLYRPFDSVRFIKALPESVQQLIVLDRTKEPGAVGEPLLLDVYASLARSWKEIHSTPAPTVLGGRYGLASKEFTPAMARAVFENGWSQHPKREFTVGIRDDVTHLSLPWDESHHDESSHVKRAVFFGLGSDGTVGANKNSVKIIGEETSLHAQGYFVYDSKKSGSTTISHLRFSPEPIDSTYLIRQAGFVACHQFDLLFRMQVMDVAAFGATFLLNSPYPADSVWEQLPINVQQAIREKELRLFVIDANRLATQSGLAGRINSIMQTCFFALAEIFQREQAIEHIKNAVRKTYSKRGEAIVERNLAAIDASLEALFPVTIPPLNDSTEPISREEEESTEPVNRIAKLIMQGHGDLLPVSALPIDGTFPTGTSKLEKRNIAAKIPIWDSDICTECGLCSLVCPHAAIRYKLYDSGALDSAPSTFRFREKKTSSGSVQISTIQVAPEDCTGCGVCVDVCPARNKQITKRKAINMEPKGDHLDTERDNFQFFLDLPEAERTEVKSETVKGSQQLLPLFEFSGACAGCGETPYLKLMSQLFGDRSVVANATGCSSIFGGNLPTTPWTKNADGRGPAWANSLFEDNAEFGLGIRLAMDANQSRVRELLNQNRDRLNTDLVDQILTASQSSEAEIAHQRERVSKLKCALQNSTCSDAIEIAQLADCLVKKSMWIVGGDGWAYDIGFGGLDHVLATGANVNILVLDTGVYSNTGGQASKATPRAATAKFASQGRNVHKKDLAMIAVSYGTVYVAQIAIGANPAQAVRAFHEAESFDGPSLILAYSTCIAHGIDMTKSMSHQKDIVKSGLWPLFRYDPRLAHSGSHPFMLDSHEPSIPFREIAQKEARFAMLAQSNPEQSNRLINLAQQDIDDTWHWYSQMASIEREYAHE